MKKLYLILALSFTVRSVAFSQETYEIYVSDAGGFSNPSPPWQILKYDQNGENGEVFISDNLGWPQDILFLEEENHVLISNLNTDQINIHDIATGDLVGLFSTQADGPTRMAIGPDGLLYVLQWNGNGPVLRFNLDGTFVDEFTQTGIPRAIGLAWDDQGNLYVASYSQSNVRVYDSNGNDNGLFIGSGLNGPTNIWFNEAGELLVNNYNLGQVLKYDASGNFIEVVLSGITWNEGIAVLPNGNYLIGGGQSGVVNEYTPDGVFVQEVISSGPPLNLQTPNAVVIQEISTLSTIDISDKDVVISPIPGDYFQLQSDSSSEIQSIEVFDVTGKLILEKEYNGEVLWDGREFPEGQYTISIRFNDGSSISRKVILSH
ncbi:MAG: T9SS type A sorting domain-containing protein [Bacteroidota bacterium]